MPLMVLWKGTKKIWDIMQIWKRLYKYTCIVQKCMNWISLGTFQCRALCETVGTKAQWGAVSSSKGLPIQWDSTLETQNMQRECRSNKWFFFKAKCIETSKKEVCRVELWGGLAMNSNQVAGLGWCKSRLQKPRLRNRVVKKCSGHPQGKRRPCKRMKS